MVMEGEGFDDPTFAFPVGGNPGTTVGEQRSNLMAHAATLFTADFSPNIDIPVAVSFSDVLPCDPDSILASVTGATQLLEGMPEAEFSNTWYPIALGKNMQGIELGERVAAIDSVFNDNLNGQVGCLGQQSWYYGYDHNPGPGQIDLLDIVEHEWMHGLGFATWVNIHNGKKLLDLDDVFMVFLRDNSLGLNWPEMTDAQRAASAIDENDLVWTGPEVAHVMSTLGAGGVTNGYPQLYAPTTLESGSSVEHWDNDVNYISGENELMSPVYSKPHKKALTMALMRDIGWTNAHYDFDEDGTTDSLDDFPHTDAADTDTDGDGLADNWLGGSGCTDAVCGGLYLDGDDDNDGVQDVVDVAPLDNQNSNETNLLLNTTFSGTRVSDDQR